MGTYFTTFTKTLKRLILQYPIECFITLLFSVVGVILAIEPFLFTQELWPLHLDRFATPLIEEYPLGVVIWFYPSLFIISYTLNTRNKIAYYASALLPFIIFVLISHTRDSSFWSDETYLAITMLATIVLFSKDWQKDNFEYSQQFFSTLFSLLGAIIITAIIIGFIKVLTITISELFSFSFYDSLVLTTFDEAAPVVLILGILPLFFLHLESQHFAIYANKLLTLILQYILTPALLIYTAVLYIYTAQIIFLQEIPSNNIVIIVVPYLCLGMVLQFLGYLIPTSSGEQKYSVLTIYRYAALLPLALLIYSVYIRVDSYGLSVARISLVTGTSLIALYYGLNLKKGLMQYRVMAMLAMLAIIFVSTPYPKIIEWHHQHPRLQAQLQQLELLDDQGRLKEPINIQALKKKDSDLLKSTQDLIYRLETINQERLYQYYGKETIQQLSEHHIQLAEPPSAPQEILHLQSAGVFLDKDYTASLYLPSTDSNRPQYHGHGHFVFYYPDNNSVNFNLQQHIKNVFAKHGLDISSLQTYNQLIELESELREVHTDTHIIVLETLSFVYSQEDSMYVIYPPDVKIKVIIEKHQSSDE